MSAPWSFSDRPKAMMPPRSSSSAARACASALSLCQMVASPSVDTPQAYQYWAP
ncbi:Uncharacterised protein [Mycobacteroides abscessus subsp. abscessus]|nr:Uncharacterised protein [Mycobacteroides abscessus subsp. abscessus]